MGREFALERKETATSGKIVSATCKSPNQKQAAPVNVIQRSAANPDSLTHSDILQLQSTIGNKAVSGLLKKPVQTKMEIGEPANAYERQADHVAQQVVQRMQGPEQVEKTGGGQHLKTFAKPMISHLQRQMQNTRGSADSTAPQELENSISRLHNGGKTLEQSIREPMEHAFGGADFSGVRIHTGSESDTLNDSLNSRAFVTGRDVFFKSGEYKPQSREGQKLIAHELTHVVQQQGGHSEKTGAQASGSVQRELKMNKGDWDYSPDLFKHKETAEEQFKSDAALWYHTMFTQPDDKTGTKEERDKLKQQQEILKRNFLAQAILGVQAGNQGTGEYQKLEDVKASGKKLAGNQIPLAALSSHGGRFGYESEDKKSGRAFKNWMLTGDTENTSQDTAGLFSRKMTHSQKYKDGGWQETGSVDKGLGMNMAFGGIGHEIKDKKDRSTTVGFGGKARAEQRRNKGKFTDYQLGSALMHYQETDTDGGSGRFMIGFEGTAPHKNNQLGAEHGVKSTLKKLLGGNANEISLTGQDKAKDAGLPSGMGALKADVTNEKMQELTGVSSALNRIKGRKGGAEMERAFYKRLLTSTTQEERDNVIKDIYKEDMSLLPTEMVPEKQDDVVELPALDYEALMAEAHPEEQSTRARSNAVTA